MSVYLCACCRRWIGLTGYWSEEGGECVPPHHQRNTGGEDYEVRIVEGGEVGGGEVGGGEVGVGAQI